MPIQLKRNDTKDVIGYSLTHADGTPVNLTGATVRFIMGKGKTLITNAAATVVNATAGSVEYTLTDSDTLAAGVFNAEFEVTFGDGKVKTYPNNGYISVNIQPNIDKDLSTYVEDQIALRVSDIEIFKTEVNTQVTQAATDAAKVNDFENRINNIVAQAGTDNTEIVDARLRNDGTVAPTVGSHLRELSTSLAQKAKQQYIDVTDAPFNAKGDGITDDTTAIQQAFDQAYTSNKPLFFPIGTYRTTGTIGIQSTLTGYRSFPSIIGVNSNAVSHSTKTVYPNSSQSGSVINYEGVGIAFRIQNDFTTSLYSGGVIKDITINHKNADRPTDGSIGLYLKGCLNYRLHNVVIMGFDKGFVNEEGYSWDSFGLTTIRNNYGILLKKNSNACGLFGTQAHQNKYGIKIIDSAGVTIDRVTLEGNTIGLIAISETSSTPTNFSIKDAHCEVMGTNAIRVGKDENDVVSPYQILQVIIDGLQYSTAGSKNPVSLNQVGLVNFNNTRIDDYNVISIGTGVKNVMVSGSVFYKNEYMGEERAVYDSYGFTANHNFIANGHAGLPNLDFINKDVPNEFKTVSYDNYNGIKCIKITLAPIATQGHKGRIPIKVDKRMVGRRVSVSMSIAVDAGVSFSPILYASPGFTTIPLGNMGTATSQEYTTFSTFISVPDADYIFLDFFVRNTNAVDANIYIPHFAMSHENSNTLSLSGNDILSGMSGRATATGAGGIVIPLVGYESYMYDVVVTPYFNGTVYVTKAKDQFTITFSGAGTASYLIIPKCGLMI